MLLGLEDTASGSMAPSPLVMALVPLIESIPVFRSWKLCDAEKASLLRYIAVVAFISVLLPLALWRMVAEEVLDRARDA